MSKNYDSYIYIEVCFLKLFFFCDFINSNFWSTYDYLLVSHHMPVIQEKKSS